MSADADPDRFVNDPTPGSQEWWYFDAISDDGRDAVVLVWYAALPFDPSYGVAALRHLDRPSRSPAPVPLDHCAVGIHWYRDGKTLAYALNGFRSEDFRHEAAPFSFAIGGNRLDRAEDGSYRLRADTPALGRKANVVADLRFVPASGSTPLERDLGAPESPHVWILAAADCRVEGRIACGPRTLEFRGRGYHDHNAGREEISRAMRRWRWGRVHDGPLTQVYYHAEPRHGPPSGVWITCRDGRPEAVREGAEFRESDERAGNVFGVRHGRSLNVTDGPAGLTDLRSGCVDDGPFYRRWVGPMTTDEGGDQSRNPLGVSELLDTRNLNRRLFNWMIPFRLKKFGRSR